MNEKEAESMYSSQEARLLKGQLDPFLGAIEAKMIQDLKFAFRKGDTDGLQLNIQVGLLCAIEDLKNLLVRQIAKGHSLSKQAEEPQKPEGGFDPYD